MLSATYFQKKYRNTFLKYIGIKYLNIKVYMYKYIIYINVKNSER